MKDTKKETPGGIIRVVNVKKAGEIERCRICGKCCYGKKEACGGELICHNEPMQLVEPKGSTAG